MAYYVDWFAYAQQGYLMLIFKKDESLASGFKLKFEPRTFPTRYKKAAKVFTLTA